MRLNIKYMKKRVMNEMNSLALPQREWYEVQF